jgi:predicted aconitase with swiveling domain
VGAIIGDIPMVDRLDTDLSELRNGVRVRVDGDKGEVEYPANEGNN